MNFVGRQLRNLRWATTARKGDEKEKKTRKKQERNEEETRKKRRTKESGEEKQTRQQRMVVANLRLMHVAGWELNERDAIGKCRPWRGVVSGRLYNARFQIITLYSGGSQAWLTARAAQRCGGVINTKLIPERLLWNWPDTLIHTSPRRTKKRWMTASYITHTISTASQQHTGRCVCFCPQNFVRNFSLTSKWENKQNGKPFKSAIHVGGGGGLKSKNAKLFACRRNSHRRTLQRHLSWQPYRTETHTRHTENESTEHRVSRVRGFIRSLQSSSKTLSTAASMDVSIRESAWMTAFSPQRGCQTNFNHPDVSELK